MTALLSVPTPDHPDRASAYHRMLTALHTAGSRITPRGDGEAVAQCPAHDDGTASLSVSRSPAGVLVHCHAGCGIDTNLTALGLARRDLFDEPGARRAGYTVTAEYPYRDEHGGVLFVKERRWPKDFRQYRPAPGGRREYRLGDVRRVLYRLPDVQAAIAAGHPVWLAEGEKDADALAAAGVTATTWPEGAWQPGTRPKWRPEYTRQLTGAHVVITADDDPPGRHTAATIAAQLRDVAASVRVVLPAEGKDAADHLAAGHGLDGFRPCAPLVDARPGQPTAVEAAPGPASSIAEASSIPVDAVTTVDQGAGKRLTLNDLHPLVEALGTPCRDPWGRPYLATATGPLPLPKRTGRGLLRDRLTLAVRATYPDRPVSAAVLDQAAGLVLAACTATDPDLAPNPGHETAEDDAPAGAVGETEGDWHEGLEDFPTGWRCPPGWVVTRAGVWREGRGDFGEAGPPVRVAYGPILVTATYTDPDEQNMADVAWLTDDGRWQTRTVPRLVTRSGKRLLAALGDEGLPVIEQDAKHVERWLAESERANRAVIPARPVARWLGWQSDTTFLASADEAVRYAVRDHRQQLAVRAHHRTGTLDGWQHAITELTPWPVAQIIVAAAFAAPLLRPLGLASTILDVHYRSSRGKSIAAKAAFSAWGDPDIAAGGIAKWSDTAYLLELRLAVARGLPVVVDESQNLGRKTPEAVTAFLYGIGNDRGTARGGDYLSSLAWSTIVISTGERSLTTFGDAQGVAPRRIPVGAPPIPTATTPADLQAVKDAIRRHEHALATNYGVAGPAFVDRLTAETTDGTGWLLARHRELTRACQGGSDWTARRAPHVAALALAAELAEQWGILPFPRPAWPVWEAVLLSDEAVAEEDQATRALSLITSALAETPTWVDHGDGREQPTGGRWIAKVAPVTINGERHHAVMVPLDVARRWFRQAGADLEAARLTWRDAGILIPYDGTEGGRPVRRWTHKARIAGSSPTPVLVFHPDIVEPPTPPKLPLG